MDEDLFNMEIRRFLKLLGITSQREIEHAVREAVANGRVRSDAKLKVVATVSLAEVGLDHKIEGEIRLG